MHFEKLSEEQTSMLRWSIPEWTSAGKLHQALRIVNSIRTEYSHRGIRTEVKDYYSILRNEPA
jgi:hypothetical protein